MSILRSILFLSMTLAALAQTPTVAGVSNVEFDPQTQPRNIGQHFRHGSALERNQENVGTNDVPVTIMMPGSATATVSVFVQPRG